MISVFQNAQTFQLSFDNGFYISASIGTSNMCGAMQTQDKINKNLTCEVFIWDLNGWVKLNENSTSFGYVDPEKLAKLIYLTSIATSRENLLEMLLK